MEGGREKEREEREGGGRERERGRRGGIERELHVYIERKKYIVFAISKL